MKNIQFIVEYRNIAEGIFLLILACLALINDIRYYKIPNKLNFTFIVIGVFFGLLCGELKEHMLGMLLPLVLFPLFMFRMMGAGDIKLFCALGAVTGFPHIVSIVAYSILFNGVIAFVLMIVRKNFRSFKKIFDWFKISLMSGMIMDYRAFDENKKSIFRYAYGIMFGCLYYIITDLILGGRYALL